MPHSSCDPSRREVLRFGGLAVTVAALTAGCSSGGDPANEVEPDPGPETTTGDRASGPETDVALLNTALSLEVLAVDTYQAGFDLSLIETSAVTEAAARFQQHHAEHQGALIAAVEAAGGEPFTTANPVVKAALVDPGVAAVAVEADFVALARDLEQAAAQLYVHATTVLSSQELRSTAMSIGAVSSRHATVLDLLGDLGNERLAVFPTDNPLPSDAVIPD